MKELRIIDRYITKQIAMNPTSAMTKEEEEQEIKDYHEVSQILINLYRENDKLKERGKEEMRKWRAKNPERAKAYSREYMREYNARKKRQ